MGVNEIVPTHFFKTVHRELWQWIEAEWDRKGQLLDIGWFSGLLKAQLVLPVHQTWFHLPPRTEWPGGIAEKVGRGTWKLLSAMYLSVKAYLLVYR